MKWSRKSLACSRSRHESSSLASQVCSLLCVTHQRHDLVALEEIQSIEQCHGKMSSDAKRMNERIKSHEKASDGSDRQTHKDNISFFTSLNAREITTIWRVLCQWMFLNCCALSLRGRFSVTLKVQLIFIAVESRKGCYKPWNAHKFIP